jgi:hypothetical protein
MGEDEAKERISDSQNTNIRAEMRAGKSQKMKKTGTKPIYSIESIG